MSTLLRTEAQAPTPAAWFSANADCLTPSEKAEDLWWAAGVLERGADRTAVWRALDAAGDLMPRSDDPGDWWLSHDAAAKRWATTDPATLARECRAESNRLQTLHALCPRCWASECQECGPRFDPREGWPVQAAEKGWGS